MRMVGNTAVVGLFAGVTNRGTELCFAGRVDPEEVECK